MSQICDREGVATRVTTVAHQGQPATQSSPRGRYVSRRMALKTKPMLAGRSPSRRMK
jgi:hypothetical protein